jgi:hypothetical protein
VPSIPWSGDGLTAELTEEGTIPQDVFDKAMVTTVEEVRLINWLLHHIVGPKRVCSRRRWFTPWDVAAD